MAYRYKSKDINQSDLDRMSKIDMSRWAPKPKSEPVRKAVEIFIDPSAPDVNARGAEVLREMMVKESAEDRLIDEAYKYLNERYATMTEAGLPTSMAAKMDGMGAITRAIPQEVRVMSPNKETRYHTEYGDVNPITGQRDIVPYMDPVTGQAMVTNFGRGATRADMDGYEKASEYVQQQVGRLAGRKMIANNTENRYGTDFTDGVLRIDGETTRPSWREGGDAIQAYTKVVDANNPNQSAERMAPALKRMFEGIIAENPNASIQDVMRIAGNRVDGGVNRYGNVIPQPIIGKAMQDDKDAILLTVLSDRDHQMNKNKDSVPVPIQGAVYQDLKAMRQTLGDITGEELSGGLQVRPNYGNNRDGESRGRVYVTPSPSRAKEFTQDLAQLTPRIRQVFDYKQ